MNEREKPQSLLSYIASHVTDRKLPEGFSLPDTSGEGGIPWADGAEDGVMMYHMGMPGMDDDALALMGDCVRAASRGDREKADRLFERLGSEYRALSVIDELQGFVIDCKDELDAGNLYAYARHALVDSADRECVKFGLSLLELFRTDRDESVREAMRTVGLSDEFALFAIFVMLRWENGNEEIWRLAQKLHGWGRIHAVERMEPETEQIREWLLTEGIRNDVMPAYSALTCWRKANAEEILRNQPTREQFSSIRDIIEALLDEGPVAGISELENREDVLLTFLQTAKTMAREQEDSEVIRGIQAYYQEREAAPPEILALCQELLSPQ